MAQERITVDPNRMRGLPSIRDTRVTVSAVLGQLAAGASIDELLADYPYLERSSGGVKLLLDANLSPRSHGSSKEQGMTRSTSGTLGC
jgi:Protein of unknown function (DUF433)